MKIIFNKIIPFKGFKCMALWPFIFVRSEKKERFLSHDERHERIHGRQQVEMLFLPFYLWYGIEYLVRALLYRNFKDAYYNISFEQEAYLKEYDKKYLDTRRHFAWLKYLFKKSFKEQ